MVAAEEEPAGMPGMAEDDRTVPSSSASSVDEDPTVSMPSRAVGASTAARDAEEEDADATVLLGPSAVRGAAEGEPGLDATVDATVDVTADATVRLGAPSDPDPMEAVAVKAAIVASPTRRRSPLRPAPVPPGYGGRAVIAPGAGAVSSYGVREIPRPPASAQSLPASSSERRGAGLPSAARRARRGARLALGGLGLAVLVSAAGLVLILRAAILGG